MYLPTWWRTNTEIDVPYIFCAIQKTHTGLSNHHALNAVLMCPLCPITHVCKVLQSTTTKQVILSVACSEVQWGCAVDFTDISCFITLHPLRTMLRTTVYWHGIPKRPICTQLTRYKWQQCTDSHTVWQYGLFWQFFCFFQEIPEKYEKYEKLSTSQQNPEAT